MPDTLNEAVAQLAANYGVAYEQMLVIVSANTDLIQGNIDDPDSFDAQGRPSTNPEHGALGYYPVTFTPGATVYIACEKRKAAMAAGAVDMDVLDTILAGKVSDAEAARDGAVEAQGGAEDARDTAAGHAADTAADAVIVDAAKSDVLDAKADVLDLKADTLSIQAAVIVVAGDVAADQAATEADRIVIEAARSAVEDDAAAAAAARTDALSAQGAAESARDTSQAHEVAAGLSAAQAALLAVPFAADAVRDDLIHTVRTTSGKALATYRKATGWKFGIATFTSIVSAAITATTAAFTNLTVSGAFTLSGGVTATRLDVSGGAFTTGVTGRALRFVTASGKVLWDISTAGVARFVSMTATAITATTGTIGTLATTAFTATTATIGSLATTGPFTTSGSLSFSGGTLQLGVAGKIFRFLNAAGKVPMQLDADGSFRGDKGYFNRLFTADGELTPGPTPKPIIAVSDTTITFTNGASVTHPSGTAAPSVMSNDPAYTWGYHGQASSMAIVDRDDGGRRVFTAWYMQQDDVNGSATTTNTFIVIAYSDDYFDVDEPAFHKCLFLLLTAGDPQLYALPDGKLQVTYGTYNDTGAVRCSYGFLIQNPGTLTESFNVGRQYFLDYGMAGQPFGYQGRTFYFCDQWSNSQHMCELTRPAYDQVVSTRISTLPRPSLTTETFYESSGVEVSGNRVRCFFRSTEGVHTRLSDAGLLTWGAEQLWTDFATPSSRAGFMKSPYSGNVIGAFNDHAVPYRTNLAWALSQSEGAIASFGAALIMEPDPGNLLNITSQYPTLTISARGDVSTIGRYEDDTSTPIEQIVIYSIHEDYLASGRATLDDVRRIVVHTFGPA